MMSPLSMPHLATVGTWLRLNWIFVYVLNFLKKHFWIKLKTGFETGMRNLSFPLSIQKKKKAENREITPKLPLGVLCLKFYGGKKTADGKLAGRGFFASLLTEEGKSALIGRKESISEVYKLLKMLIKLWVTPVI